VNTSEIIAALDAEIARLQQARNLLAQASSADRGSRHTTTAQPRESAKRRVLSPEARKRIAAAQRKRWAKLKRAARKEEAPKNLPEQKARQTKKAPVKSAKKTVHMTKMPAKARPERKPRSAKRAPAANALSTRAEVVAVNKPETTA
jgi:hypothetical protein